MCFKVENLLIFNEDWRLLLILVRKFRMNHLQITRRLHFIRERERERQRQLLSFDSTFLSVKCIFIYKICSINKSKCTKVYYVSIATVIAYSLVGIMAIHWLLMEPIAKEGKKSIFISIIRFLYNRTYLVWVSVTVETILGIGNPRKRSNRFTFVDFSEESLKKSNWVYVHIEMGSFKVFFLDYLDQQMPVVRRSVFLFGKCI